MNLKKLEPSQRIIHLISGYISGSLSDDESMELKNWTNQSAANTLLFEELTNADYRSEILKKWMPEETEESLRSLKLRLPEKRKIWWPYAAAATVAFLLGITYYQVQVDKHPVQQKIVQEIRPGSDNATLTLAGGEKIDLASAANGKLAQQSNVLIQKQLMVDYCIAMRIKLLLQQKPTPSIIRFQPLWAGSFNFNCPTEPKYG